MGSILPACQQRQQRQHASTTASKAQGGTNTHRHTSTQLHPTAVRLCCFAANHRVPTLLTYPFPPTVSPTSSACFSAQTRSCFRDHRPRDRFPNLAWLFANGRRLHPPSSRCHGYPIPQTCPVPPPLLRIASSTIVSCRELEKGPL